MKQNTNLSSEFYVASQLFRLGHTVTLTLGHTKEIDLIVVHEDGRTVTVDVKGLKNKSNWPCAPKLRRADHFFIFVTWMNKFSNLNVVPEVFVVPSLEIDSLLKTWRKSVTKVTCVDYSTSLKGSKYQDAWDLLFGKE